MERQFVRIVEGPFAGCDAELVSADGPRLTARVPVSGRQTTVVLHRDQVERPDDVPVRWPGEAEDDRQDLAVLRERTAAQYDELAHVKRFDFFLERAGLPTEDPAREWEAYTASCAEIDDQVRRRKAAALEAFDQEIAPLPAAEASRRVAADPGRWLPAEAAMAERRSRFPGIDGPTAEQRLQAAIFGASDPAPAPRERARHRRAAARSAAELRDYAVWRAANRPREVGERARPAALAQVERERAVVEDRFARDWGFGLPGSIFRFRAFLLSLCPAGKRALDELELAPYGIMDLFTDPGRGTQAGIDVRVHGRYYRDPPEFVTFMHGGTDGLHFGLWYDDGRTCAGVASYYNNDGGGVGLPSGTPLEAVRRRLEWGWRDLEDEDDEPAGPLDPDLAARRHRLRLLREVLMTFETGDRDEQGKDYHDAYGPSPEVCERGAPDRLETLDGGGALVDGDTAIERGRQRPWSGYDFCTTLQKELTGDPAARDALVAEAHHRHRDLPRVHVLETT